MKIIFVLANMADPDEMPYYAGGGGGVTVSSLFAKEPVKGP